MERLQETDIAMLCLEDGDIDIDWETGIIVYIGLMIDISIRKAYIVVVVEQDTIIHHILE